MEATASRDSSSPNNETDFNASASSKKSYEFDDLPRLVGGFGRYQMMLYGFMCLMTIPIGLQQLVLVFYGASPSFQCAVPASTAAINNNSFCPVDECCANCTKYEFNGKFTSAVSEVSSISDHFGRKIAIFLSIAFLAGCGTVSAVADCLSMFVLFRVGAGAAAVGCLLSRFVYCMELSVTSNRTAAGWIPESPRWLLANNRLYEVHSLLMKYAAKNGVTVDAKHLKHVISEVRKADVRKDDTRKYGTLDLFRTPKLRKRIIICSFNWFVNALVYFGLTLNVKNLAGDMYVNFFILIIIELPSALLAWFCLQRFGRRIPYCAFMLIGGVAGMFGVSCTRQTGIPASDHNPGDDRQVLYLVHITYNLRHHRRAIPNSHQEHRHWSVIHDGPYWSNTGPHILYYWLTSPTSTKRCRWLYLECLE
ncbi:hypothetical protein OS493_036752 [Desmophyllum pertusum]|uniref:Organic cation transporter protein n=1 Tax=Desmophyllum pertusum TaxID=174260 RepID=A0A9W9Z738_9CNID|nr:hypothetical protein OS493_036752 [Desmophyllum pertusum]